MYKKKEITIIISIISITILLAFLPVLINTIKNNRGTSNKTIIEDTKTLIDDNFIEIKIEGEIINKIDDEYVNYIYLKIPKGYTFGFILNKIKPYLTNYAICDIDLKTQYFKNQTIHINSIDSGFENEEDNNLININTASKYELMTLYGIGDKRSDCIIEYRINNKIDDFKELQDLISVSDVVIEKIKEKAICQ